tara:strand:- start:1248 stop:1631 length:384 start_codon:yes stop_codon:yes gene_type:complete
MHGMGPKLIIMAKKEVLGEEMPDFDGDSFVEAKKKMMMGDDEGGPKGDDKYSDDPHMAMKEMAKELYKASKLHAGQADKLIEICEEMYGKESDEDKSEDSDDDSKDSDDKPHKSYGDHNPYGSSKSY